MMEFAHCAVVAIAALHGDHGEREGGPAGDRRRGDLSAERAPRQDGARAVETEADELHAEVGRRDVVGFGDVLAVVERLFLDDDVRLETRRMPRDAQQRALSVPDVGNTRTGELVDSDRAGGRSRGSSCAVGFDMKAVTPGDALREIHVAAKRSHRVRRHPIG